MATVLLAFTPNTHLIKFNMVFPWWHPPSPFTLLSCAHLINMALPGSVHRFPDLGCEQLVTGELQGLSTKLHEAIGGLTSAVDQNLGQSPDQVTHQDQIR